MPNWCGNSILIKSTNKIKLVELYNKILECTSKEYIKSDFGKRWLGNIVLGAEIGTVDTGEDTDLACRGWIESMCFETEHQTSQISIFAQTAWTPTIELWHKLVEKYCPKAKVIYSAEEPGCELFETNDPEWKGGYVLIDNSEDGGWYWAREEDMLKELQHITADYDCEIIEVLKAKLPDQYSICPITYVDDDWN